jgi:hypothetical protein
MKNCFLLLIALFDFITAFAQLENTRWKTTLQIDNTPVNSLLDFKKDTVLLYTVADSTMIESMMYTKDDSSFTLIRIDGQSSCGDIPGKYGFSIKDDHLSLALLKDECYDRYNVIENTVWTKWKDYPGIAVSENILKQYTGVYAMDVAHPITISLENGTLYAEGPNNGLPKSPFIPITASTFFLRVAGVKMDFIKDPNGNVIKMISHEEKDYELKKIK